MFNPLLSEIINSPCVWAYTSMLNPCPFVKIMTVYWDHPCSLNPCVCVVVHTSCCFESMFVCMTLLCAFQLGSYPITFAMPLCCDTCGVNITHGWFSAEPKKLKSLLQCCQCFLTLLSCCFVHFLDFFNQDYDAVRHQKHQVKSKILVPEKLSIPFFQGKWTCTFFF